MHVGYGSVYDEVHDRELAASGCDSQGRRRICCDFPLYEISTQASLINVFSLVASANRLGDSHVFKVWRL